MRQAIARRVLAAHLEIDGSHPGSNRKGDS